MIKPKVQAGYQATAGLSINGELFLNGANYSGQQLKPVDDNEHPTHKIEGWEFIDISFGPGQHGLAIDTNNDVWHWGENWDGQAGIGETGEPVPEFRKVLVPKCKMVFTSDYGSMAITLNDEVYVWGYGNTTVYNSNNWDEVVDTPIKILDGVGEIVAGSCGGSNSGVVTKDGNVYGWSNPNWNDADVGSTTPLELTDITHKCIGVEMFSSISSIITENGEVYAWGGEISEYPNLIKIEIPEKVKQLTTFMWYTLALDENGGVWIWEADSTTANKIELPASVNIDFDSRALRYLKTDGNTGYHSVSNHSIWYAEDDSMFLGVYEEPQEEEPEEETAPMQPEYADNWEPIIMPKILRHRMVVEDVHGEKRLVVDYKNVERTREVNGSYTLAFTLLKTDKNKHSYDYVENENIIIYHGVEYVIKRVGSRIIGKKPIKIVKCELKAYNDLIDGWQYGVIGGSIQINTAMDHALKDTDYTFTIHGEFTSRQFENLGDNNPLALISTIMERYGAEFTIEGTHIGVYNQVGNDTNAQFRYRHNIGTIRLECETENFATYIRGFGANGLEVEYESPLAQIFGRRHAAPVRDERFTNADTLTEECRRRVDDEFRISIEIDYVEVKKNGKNIHAFGLGDRLYMIHGELALKNRVRVLGITDYPESNKQPRLKIANVVRDARNMLADFNATKQTVDRVVVDGRVVNAALEADAQYTIDSINRTFNQVDYVEDGIRLTDPTIFMHYLLLRRGGIFATKDNGENKHPVITPDGVNLQYTYGILGGSKVTINANTTFAAGYDPSTKAPADHNHDGQYAALNHNHDGRYYRKQEVDDAIDAAATVEDWQEPQLLNDWEPYGPDWSQPGFYKDRGRVYLRGTITAGVVATVAIELPEDYRPPLNESHGGIDVMSNGQVIINDDAAKISLDNISFRV